MFCRSLSRSNSATPGSRRLVDILKQTSTATLEKQSNEKSKLEQFMEETGCDTRFLMNRFVIEPKALCLLDEPVNLSKYKLFAIYKPPFCPMRRAEAAENFHKVSVEGFIDHALASQKVLPVVRDVKKKNAEGSITVRIQNDLELYCSGPVVVALDQHSYFASLRGAVFTYEVMVYGELMRQQRRDQDVPINLLYGESALVTTMPDTRAVSTFIGGGYYGAHPASHMKLVVQSPPTAKPPNLRAYAEKILESFVIGDPTKQPIEYKKSITMVPQRGDADFSRVFEHLQSITLRVKERDDKDQETDNEVNVGFSCDGCFDGLLVEHLRVIQGKRKITYLDGMWSQLKAHYKEAGDSYKASQSSN